MGEMVWKEKLDKSLLLPYTKDKFIVPQSKMVGP